MDSREAAAAASRAKQRKAAEKERKVAEEEAKAFLKAGKAVTWHPEGGRSSASGLAEQRLKRSSERMSALRSIGLVGVGGQDDGSERKEEAAEEPGDSPGPHFLRIPRSAHPSLDPF